MHVIACGDKNIHQKLIPAKGDQQCKCFVVVVVVVVVAVGGGGSTIIAEAY